MRHKVSAITGGRLHRREDKEEVKDDNKGKDNYQGHKG